MNDYIPTAMDRYNQDSPPIKTYQYQLCLRRVNWTQLSAILGYLISINLHILTSSGGQVSIQETAGFVERILSNDLGERFWGPSAPRRPPPATVGQLHWETVDGRVEVEKLMNELVYKMVYTQVMSSKATPKEKVPKQRGKKVRRNKKTAARAVAASFTNVNNTMALDAPGEQAMSGASRASTIASAGPHSTITQEHSLADISLGTSGQDTITCHEDKLTGIMNNLKLDNSDPDLGNGSLNRG